MSYDNIPDELKAYPQFVCWRYETVDTVDGKPTKVPYSPRDGRKADVNDPSTWVPFETALEICDVASFDGVGFVLTENDPFAFIDLDAEDKHGNAISQDDVDRQVKIYEAFPSYAEKSPSGKGLHIIVKGAVPSGRKRSHIEIYSSRRFMTMTGNVFRQEKILEAHNLLNIVWAQLAPKGSNSTSNYDGPQVEEDGAIFDRAANASNGEKFRDLYTGNWQLHYPSQSEADFALINMFAFYTQNREQITRMFRGSALGERSKANRDSYVNWMLNRAFDRMLPPADFEAIREHLKQTVETIKEQAAMPEPVNPIQRADEITRPMPTLNGESVTTAEGVVFPPGLLGDIAQYIYAASPRPVREIALAAAIGLMAGICGRAYNVSSAGLNQYMLVIARTGRGKEALHSGVDRLMHYVIHGTDYSGAIAGAAEFLGPAEIASSPALQKTLQKQPSCVSRLGEIGLLLQQLSDPRAPSNMKGLERSFLSLYSKSGRGNTLGKLVYSDSDKSVNEVYAPAFTILGETAPESFFDHLTEEMVRKGLLPRFLVIEFDGDRPALNRNHSEMRPTPQLVQGLSQLCQHALGINQSNEAISVEFDEAADDLARQFNDHCDNEINRNKGDVASDFWTRAWLKSLKLAALVAVGINPWRPCIDHSTMAWAIEMVVRDVKTIVSRFSNGQVYRTNDESAQVNEVKAAIKHYLLMDPEAVARAKVPGQLHADGVVPYSWISRRISNRAAFRNDRLGPTRALKRTMDQLCEVGAVEKLGPTRLGAYVSSQAIKSPNALYFQIMDGNEIVDEPK